MNTKQGRTEILRKLGRPCVEAWLDDDKGISIRLRSDQINDLMERVGAAIEAERWALQSQLAQLTAERDALRDSASIVAFQAHQIDGQIAESLTNHAATRMREACVNAIKTLRATPRGAACNNAINDAIHKVESLTLDQMEQEKSK